MQDKDKKLTTSDLAQFTGTEEWFKHFTGLLYTDGIQYMAEAAGAYWLIDLVASVQPQLREEAFQCWILKVDLVKHSAVMTCDDGNGNVLYTQEIPFTDFPIAEIKFYVVDNILLLTSEY